MTVSSDDAQRQLERKALRNVRELVDKMENSYEADAHTQKRLLVAIVIVIVAFIFFIFSEPLRYSVYNVFLNPFSEPREMSEFIWLTVIYKNRLYLMILSALCLLYGMFNLQFREKFV